MIKDSRAFSTSHIPEAQLMIKGATTVYIVGGRQRGTAANVVSVTRECVSEFLLCQVPVAKREVV